MSFAGSLLLAPPEKRKIVRNLAVVFGIATVIAVGAEWLAALLNQQGTSSPEFNQSEGASRSYVTLLGTVPFFVKFAIITFIYVGLFCFVYWLFTQIQTRPLSFHEAAVAVWGSHLGRLRTLLLAGTMCFVLVIIYPGPPLISDDSFESLRKGLHVLWDGTEGARRPALPAETRTWFWGQASLLYLGCSATYLLFAFPHEVAVAWQAGSAARKEVIDTSSPADNNSSADALSAFVFSLVRQLRAISRDTGTKN